MRRFMAAHHGARRRAPQVHGLIAISAVVWLSCGLLRPARAMRPEHQLASAVVSQASKRQGGARSGPNVWYAPTAAKIGADEDASSDATRQHMTSVSIRGRGIDASPAAQGHRRHWWWSDRRGQRGHLADRASKAGPQLSAGVQPNIDDLGSSKDLAPSSLGRFEESVFTQYANLRDMLDRATADPLSDNPLCEDRGGRFVGCKPGNCRCHWHQQCYTRKSGAEPFEDYGVCGWSMTMMALATVVTACVLLLVTVSCRLWLQHRDFLHEHEQRTLRRPPLLQGNNASFLDEFAARRKMVHDEGLVRKTLGHFSSNDTLPPAGKELFGDLPYGLQSSEG